MVHQSADLTDNERTALTIIELKRTAQEIDSEGHLIVKEYRKTREFINQHSQRVGENSVECIGYVDTITIVTMKK